MMDTTYIPAREAPEKNTGQIKLHDTAGPDG